MVFLRLVFWAFLVLVGVFIGDRYGMPEWARALPDKVLGEREMAQPAAVAPSVASVATPSAAASDDDALACGEASYYADSLAGNSTASGEPYDPAKLTAAHRTLAFGTTLRVVRTDTGASVNVVVNDRGPYADDRLIDLSRAAAERLDLITAGVAEVCIFD